MEYKVRFCDQCGAKLEEGAKFCTKCGSKIYVADPAAVLEENGNGQIEQPSFICDSEPEVEYIEPMPQFMHVDVQPESVEGQEVENVESEQAAGQEAVAEPEIEYIEPEQDEDATVALSEQMEESVDQKFARMAKPANLQKVRSGEYVNVDKPEFIVGKNPLRTDFAIRDNNTVSRVHASIRWTEDGYSIADLGSMNGTFVNGVPVGEGEQMLYDGDIITLSDEEFKFAIIDI